MFVQMVRKSNAASTQKTVDVSAEWSRRRARRYNKS